MSPHRHLALAALLALGPALACEGKQGPAASAAKAAPELRATTLDGEPFDLGALRGQVVLLNMWATWCEPCRKELPELARLHRKHDDQGFSVVAVNVDVERMRKRVAAMVGDLDLPFPIVLDPENVSIPRFEVVGYPTSFLIGRDSTIRWRRDGIILENDVELAELLEAVLAEPL